MNKMDEMIAQVKMVPSMPVTIVKLGSLLSDPKTELEEIVKVIQYDPGFTANILKMANFNARAVAPNFTNGLFNQTFSTRAKM